MKRTSLVRVVWRPVRSLLGSAVRASTGAVAIHTVEPEGHHISVSADGRYPTWDELASARDHFAPTARFHMVFPTADEYVNLHETCLHLWEER